MTITSVAHVNSKTAEFARLFDLFDRVATRRTRAPAGDTSKVISADDIANVPAEFAPVLENLSTILSLRTLRNEEHARRAQTASTTKVPNSKDALAGVPPKTVTTQDRTPRVEGTKSSGEQVEEDPESPAFPFGERYPFTFKLMLHKLYDLDEWVEKVKNAVETSRSQFKPLAEGVQNAANLDLAVNVDETAEKRSSVRPVLGASAKLKLASLPRLHATTAPFKPETNHVLKKRCIGRRKSINGPMSSGVWVYDAAISATEVASPRPIMEITLSAPRNARGAIENRARHHSMMETPARDAAKHEVKIAVSLLQKKASEDTVSPKPSSMSLLLSKPAQEGIQMGSAAKRRRSVVTVTAFASQSCKTAAVKRPLCV